MKVCCRCRKGEFEGREIKAHVTILDCKMLGDDRIKGERAELKPELCDECTTKLFRIVNAFLVPIDYKYVSSDTITNDQEE